MYQLITAQAVFVEIAENSLSMIKFILLLSDWKGKKSLAGPNDDNDNG